MDLSAREIAERLDAQLVGDGAVRITGVAALSDAQAGDLTFMANPRYAAAVAETKASVVLVNADWEGEAPCTVLRVKSSDAAFAQVVALFAPPVAACEPGVHESAVVDPDAELGADVSVGPLCVIEAGTSIGARTVLMAGCYIGGNTRIGEDCRLYPNVSTREYTTIGDRVIIHNGAVIGSDGFGYVRESGTWKKIPQVGVVEIQSDVEIGANTTIDRARFGKTVIEQGTKIDNLVQIAHNVTVGAHSAVAAQVGVSGSTAIGSRVQIGGQAGLAGHISVGDNSVIGAQSGVTKDVTSASFVSGYPAMPHHLARRTHAHMMRIPELKKKLKTMEQRLAALEAEHGGVEETTDQ